MQPLRTTRVFMDTPVTVTVVGGDGHAAIQRAFGHFREVEAVCNRFDPGSEVRQLASRPGEPVAVSPLLLQAVRFALAVARRTGGAFDPSIGLRQEARGFDRDYRSGRRSPSGLHPAGQGTYRDVRCDARAGTITLRQPLLLDLGAVAKGLAIDLAIRELRPFPGGAVEAGGDIAAFGTGPGGGPWRIGIRHPRRPDAVCAVVQVEDAAVCTSGDYERLAPDGSGHHLLNPRTGRSPQDVASCTVVAPHAMVADALATAAFVLGAERGPQWLQTQGIAALLLTPELERRTTPGWEEYAQCL